MSPVLERNAFVTSIQHISVKVTMAGLIESGLVSHQICYLLDVTLVACLGFSLLWERQNTQSGPATATQRIVFKTFLSLIMLQSVTAAKIHCLQTQQTHNNNNKKRSLYIKLSIMQKHVHFNVLRATKCSMKYNKTSCFIYLTDMFYVLAFRPKCHQMQGSCHSCSKLTLMVTNKITF